MKRKTKVKTCKKKMKEGKEMELRMKLTNKGIKEKVDNERKK